MALAFPLRYVVLSEIFINGQAT